MMIKYYIHTARLFHTPLIFSALLHKIEAAKWPDLQPYAKLT